MAETFGPKGLDVVYVGAMESAEACEQWKKEHDLPFPVVSDPEGSLFRRITNGWVPFNLLVGPDGRVLFCENEFDEGGYSREIARLCGAGEASSPEPKPTTAAAVEAARSTGRTIVVLGGGTGGVVAADRLRKRLPKQHRIVLADRSSQHLFAPSLLWMMIGKRRADQIHRPLSHLRGRGIDFQQGEVKRIDVERRLVETTAATFPFDYLVVSLGAETTPHLIPGFGQAAYDLYSVEGCDRLRAALDRFVGGSIGVLVPSLPFKCPAAPYEAAFLIEAFCRKRGIRNKTEIHLFTPEHQPLPVAGRAFGAAVEEMLRGRGIHYHPLFTFKELKSDGKQVVSSDGQIFSADLLITVPPHQAPNVLREAGLLGVSGWIHVEPSTLKTAVDGVYAIGDATSIKLPNGKMLPKAGVFAHAEAEVVAENIAAEVEGTVARGSFRGKGYCWVELGDGKAGFASGDFFAEPEPKVKMYGPGYLWHWGKIAFEQWWLRRWFRTSKTALGPQAGT